MWVWNKFVVDHRKVHMKSACFLLSKCSWLFFFSHMIFHPHTLCNDCLTAYHIALFLSFSFYTSCLLLLISDFTHGISALFLNYTVQFVSLNMWFLFLLPLYCLLFCRKHETAAILCKCCTGSVF